MERFAIKIDKKLKANLYKICRLCGIDNPDMVPIIPDKQIDKMESSYIDVEAEMEMQQKINLLIGLSITKDDKMPQTMCCLCVDKINDFYEFREMCYATNAQTRKLLGLKNIKKTALDIKPKVEVKEESIVPTSTLTPVSNKNGSRKRKSDDVFNEEGSETAISISKKKLRFSFPMETNVKEEISGLSKKKSRFTTSNEDSTVLIASSYKKSKTNTIEDPKMKKEPSPPVSLAALAVTNKKLRLVTPQKEYITKKSKQKSGKLAEQKESDVKEEIKEEIKEELAPVPAHAPQVKATPVPKLKFGCNICKERFPAKVNLETHTKTAHVPKIERYVCTACNEVLTKSFDIKNHQLWHKLSKTPYVCGCCGESILNTYAFSRHLREHAFETPPALLVLDRECPQCHISYATNFLYNIHICAVKTKRCAGCNRLQRNEAEYLKHSAQCAKVYLNYSKHIMPSVEALEDAVRIKNENDVEAAAEEMARISGVPLDMAPVVQLTRLSSPLIMAASQCVSMAGLDDVAGSSGKKSSKKGVSKRDLKRVDELLKSTLDALVSIKHEPEVHVDQEIPIANERSENEDNADGADFEDFRDDDSDNNSEEANTSLKVVNMESSLDQTKIKQEIDEISEENPNKVGGGLKLKIKKEHGQLNSSIIEQQKSSEKRGEKRKKKKKHKDKEKEKQKLSKDLQDEYVSQDAYTGNFNSDINIENTTIRIKAEPQEGTEASEKLVASVLQARAQPEATIMTSIPMMQFQIACVSSGVEFNKGSNSVIESHQTIHLTNQGVHSEDVKPNREELDRILKISHVSSGIAMNTDEVGGTETQQMDSIFNYGKENSPINEEDGNDEASMEDEHHDEENESEYQDDNNSEHPDDEKREDDVQIENNVEKLPAVAAIQNKLIYKKLKALPQTKTKLTPKSNDKLEQNVAKSRNKACKSTAKPPNMPSLQISAVQSGVSLETSSSINDFAPVFIKPEPQNRGYCDEQPVEAASPTHLEQDEVPPTQSVEEQNYISSIDFNNITIKQEKDIEINDVQITQTSISSFTELNGVKRKRKQMLGSNCIKHKTELDEKTEDKNEYMEDEELEDDKDEEGNYDEELDGEEEDDDEGEDDDEEVEDEDDEEREYRELEYPPQLLEKTDELESEEYNAKAKENNYETTDENSSLKKDIKNSPKNVDSSIPFVITSVCSHATTEIPDVKFTNANDNADQTKHIVNYNELLPKNMCDEDVLNITANSEQQSNKTEESCSREVKEMCFTENKEGHETPLSFVAGCSYNSAISRTTVEKDVSVPLADMYITNQESQTNNSYTASSLDLQENIQPQGISLVDFPNRQNPHILESALHSFQSAHYSGELKSSEEVSKQESREEFQTLSKPRPQSTSPCKSEDSVLNKDSNMTNIQGNTKTALYHPSAGAQNECKDLEDKSTIQNSQEMQLKAHSVLETLSEAPMSKASGPTFNVSPENDLNHTPFKNYDDHKTNDNQDQVETIEGTFRQLKDLNSEARPTAGNFDTESANEETDDDDADEEENEFELEKDNNNDNPTLGSNLEEIQNYHNQEVLAQVRPTALTLHPYLEDISSSSNSLLSNSLSQTPPLQPATSTLCIDEFNMQRQRQQRLLNIEETENILNESNCVHRRRSPEVAEASDTSARQLLPQHQLGQQLPLHMPTYNFDNINEIAENNNNANIEREQLQDGQQQHMQIQQSTTNIP